ncbi:MAG TPA: antibiotic biosynthesis monooxygenase [Ktedonobacterales bacterium]|jgi:quinol monooxygenase YgiN
MFVTVFTFHAKPGREDAVFTLFDEWQRDRRAFAKGFVSGDLYRDTHDPGAFISVASFESERDLRTLAATPEQDTWYRKLVALSEREPVFTDCEVEWRVR